MTTLFFVCLCRFSVDFSSSQLFPFNQPKCSLQTNTFLRAIFIPALSVSSMHMCLSFSQLSRVCRTQNEWNKWQIKRSKRFTLRARENKKIIQFFRCRSVVYSSLASQSYSCTLCVCLILFHVSNETAIIRLHTVREIVHCTAHMPCLLESNVLMKRAFTTTRRRIETK